MKIGFFDSGLGGLTILKSTVARLPNYDYLYYGDTKNLPYGDKSEEEIYRLTKEAITYLFENKVVLAIIACNTASAETLRRLQDTFLPQYPGRKILGVIIPTIETLLEQGAKHAVLIGTQRTIDSDKYNLELKKRNAGQVKVSSVATPSLVDLIEKNNVTQALEKAISGINTIREGEVDTVILGCTHYTILKNDLRSYYGESKYIISQDEIIPQKLKKYLQNHPEIKQLLTQNATRIIELTEQKGAYEAFAANLL